MNDSVNHPSHYTTTPKGFSRECIDYTEGMNFCLGNAFKYVYRAGMKGTKEDEETDYRKALWYLDWYIDSNGTYVSQHPLADEINPARFGVQSEILFNILLGRIDVARDMISKRIGGMVSNRNEFNRLREIFESARTPSSEVIPAGTPIIVHNEFKDTYTEFTDGVPCDLPANEPDVGIVRRLLPFKRDWRRDGVAFIDAGEEDRVLVRKIAGPSWLSNDGRYWKISDIERMDPIPAISPYV